MHICRNLDFAIRRLKFQIAIPAFQSHRVTDQRLLGAVFDSDKTLFLFKFQTHPKRKLKEVRKAKSTKPTRKLLKRDCLPHPPPNPTSTVSSPPFSRKLLIYGDRRRSAGTPLI